MKNTLSSITLAAILGASTLLLSSTAFACEGMGPNKHMGSITSVNAADKTFTIQDAQLQIPVTFKANDEIMQAISGSKGSSIQVNYEEDDGTLTALGVIL